MIFNPQLAALHQRPVPANTVVNQRLLDGRGEFLGYLRRRLGSLDEAEDALQDFSLKVIRATQTVEREEKINAWLGQILRHTLIDHYRRRAVRHRAETAYAMELSITEGSLGDDCDIFPCRCLHVALPRLRPEHAAILRRADLDEEPRASIAADLRITTNSLNVRLHRARRALKQELEISCPTCRKASFLECHNT